MQCINNNNGMYVFLANHRKSKTQLDVLSFAFHLNSLLFSHNSLHPSLGMGCDWLPGDMFHSHDIMKKKKKKHYFSKTFLKKKIPTVEGECNGIVLSVEQKRMILLV